MSVYEDIEDFYENYAGEKCSIGRSAEGRELYAFFAGTHGGAVGICQYAIHAREWITAYLGLEHIRRGVCAGGVWFIPLMNPDGVVLATQGIESVKSSARRGLLLGLNGGGDFSLWKANTPGVDLNVNFPARWGKGKSNVREAAPENYIGACPLSAPESRALSEFTVQINPNFTMSFHTKGEEIYWRFPQSFSRARRDRRLAKRLSKSTGYPLKETLFSAGGYKDWCVEELKIPAFTVEVGSDNLTHPLGLDALEEITSRCGNAVYEFTEGF